MLSLVGKDGDHVYFRVSRAELEKIKDVADDAKEWVSFNYLLITNSFKSVTDNLTCQLQMLI